MPSHRSRRQREQATASAHLPSSWLSTLCCVRISLKKAPARPTPAALPAATSSTPLWDVGGGGGGGGEPLRRANRMALQRSGCTTQCMQHCTPAASPTHPAASPNLRTCRP